MIYNTRPEIGVMIQQKVSNAHAQYNQSKNYRAKITYTFQYCVCEHEEEF